MAAPPLSVASASNVLFAQAADRPNIILIMADDLGWGDVAYNGNSIVQTPCLDAMAREAVRLDRFYAAAPVCSPTRGSCLTGRHPYRYGIEWAGETPLRSGEFTLAETLRAAGYATGHFGKWHVGGLSKTVKQSYFEGQVDPATYSPPWENGFDECFSTESMMPTYNPYYHVGGEFGTDEILTPTQPRRVVRPLMTAPPVIVASASNYRHLQSVPVELGQRTNGFRWRDHYWTGPGQIVDEWLEGDDSKLIMDRAIDFIARQAEAGTPSLTLIWFHTPHTPLVASNEDREAYSNQSMEAQHWYGAITAMDRQVGRLRDWLKEQGLSEFFNADSTLQHCAEINVRTHVNGGVGINNTLVCFCSDNGPSYIHDYNSAGPFQGKKATLWEGGIRVPAIIEWPGRLPGGTVVDAPISTSDLYPTILAAAGVAMPEGQPILDGINVMPLLEGSREIRGEPIAFQAPVKSEQDVLAVPGSLQSALCDDRYKLISVDGGDQWRLFDLIDDPGETNDLAEEQPERVRSMRTALENWIESCERSERGEDYQ